MKTRNESIIINQEKTPRPHILDVVKIGSRWAQVRLAGNDIIFLDDGSHSKIS